MHDTLTAISQWIIRQPSLLLPEQAPVSANPFTPLSPKTEDDYQGSARLGFVYQELCRRLFARHPDYRIIAQEVQLREGKQTVGAIDFLLRHKEQTEHWEVAIKFYLLKEGLWYGPDSRDRLDIKLARMLDHQLTISNTPAFKSVFTDIGPVTPKLLMQGRLYLNPFTPEPLPQHCLGHPLNLEQAKGLWCHQHQMKQIDEPLYQLEKRYWIMGNPKLTIPVTQLPTDRAIHCQSASGQFWMIVPNSWPE